MSIATAANWLSNFVISVTFPLLTDSIGLSNAVFGYTALAAMTFCFVYFLVPETKGKTLEEVTEVCIRFRKNLLLIIENLLTCCVQRCCEPIRSQ